MSYMTIRVPTWAYEKIRELREVVRKQGFDALDLKDEGDGLGALVGIAAAKVLADYKEQRETKRRRVG